MLDLLGPRNPAEFVRTAAFIRSLPKFLMVFYVHCRKDVKYQKGGGGGGGEEERNRSVVMDHPHVSVCPFPLFLYL